MASTCRQKWLKYFSQDEIQTKIKSVVDVPVHDAHRRLIDSLSPGHLITVPLVSDYSPRYFIKYNKDGAKEGYIQERFVAKPLKLIGPTENLHIRTDSLTKYGERRTVQYNGSNVEVMFFDKETYLANSIYSGLKENPNVSKTIEGVFAEYFSGMMYNKIAWNDQIKQTDINELGKYVGEVIVGLMTLSSNVGTYFNSNFTTGDVKGFAVPIKSNFAQIDSFLVMNNDTVIGNKIVPVSNKFGVGASSSVFKGILPEVINHTSPVDSWVLKDLYECNKNSRNVKEALYKYGINHIIQYKMYNPYEVYYHLLNNIDSEHTRYIIDFINNSDADPIVKANLPYSVTSYFARETAKRLTSCSISQAAIKSIITEKNFWQASLDKIMWSKGDVKYNVNVSADCNVKICYGKSNVTDLSGQHGLLTYSLSV